MLADQYQLRKGSLDLCPSYPSPYPILFRRIVTSSKTCCSNPLLQDSPVIIYPILNLIEIPAFVMSIEIRTSPGRPTEADEQRRHIAPALECDA